MEIPEDTPAFSDHGDILKQPNLSQKKHDIKSSSPRATAQSKSGNKNLTIETLTYVLAELKISVKYNVIWKDVEITVPAHESSPDNYYITARALIISELNKRGYRTGDLDNFLLYIADKNKYNSAAEMVLSVPHDGRDRLKSLYDTIDAEDNHAKEVFIFKFLVTVIAAIFEPHGISAAGLLVLQGPQRMGKTWWFRKLFPADIRDKVFKDGVFINPHDRDDLKKCLRNVVSELGELDGILRKNDIAALKAFVTADRDVIRLPYLRKEQTFPRRTVLCATVNNRNFLSDPTGNGRFWTVACRRIDSYHDIDMQQLWAQVYELYRAGEKWSLTPEELALVNEVNEHHEQADFPSEKVTMFYEWNFPLHEWKTASQIADDIGIRNPTKSDLTAIGMTVRRLNGGVAKRSNGCNIVKVPPRRQ